MSRRANGEGSIYLRADGRWEGAVWVSTSSGRRRRIRVYGTTRAEAHRKLLTALKNAADGIPAPDKPWKLGPYLDHWLDVAKPLLAPTTYATYTGLVRNYLKPGLGTKRLTGLSVITVQQYFNDQLNRGVTIRTVQKQRVALSAALTQAMREELIVRNVARVVRLPASERKKITPWSVEQLTQFLTAAKPDPLYPALLIVAMYGLRSGEVRGLRWSDIDWTRNLIHVQQQVQRYDGAMHARRLKTKASKRDLPLLLSVRAALGELWEQANTPADTEALIFVTRTGNPIETGNLLRTFRRISAAQGLPIIKLHHLRHTTTTLLKNIGVPDRDIQLILGHESVLTTVQLYQHGDIEKQQAALTTLERSTLGTAAIACDNSRQPQQQVMYFRRAGRPNYFGHTALAGSSGARLFSSTTDPSSTSLTDVYMAAYDRYRVALLGGVAVKLSRQAEQ